MDIVYIKMHGCTCMMHEMVYQLSDDDMVDDDVDDNEDDYNDDDFEIYCIIIQITLHRMKSHI